jgi:hypothetical protein
MRIVIPVATTFTFDILVTPSISPAIANTRALFVQTEAALQILPHTPSTTTELASNNETLLPSMIPND